MAGVKEHVHPSQGPQLPDSLPEAQSKHQATGPCCESKLSTGSQSSEASAPGRQHSWRPL